MKSKTPHIPCDKGLYVPISSGIFRANNHLCLQTRSKCVTIPPGGCVTRIHLAPLGQGGIQPLSEGLGLDAWLWSSFYSGDMGLFLWQIPPHYRDAIVRQTQWCWSHMFLPLPWLFPCEHFRQWFSVGSPTQRHHGWRPTLQKLPFQSPVRGSKTPLATEI